MFQPKVFGAATRSSHAAGEGQSGVIKKCYIHVIILRINDVSINVVVITVIIKNWLSINRTFIKTSLQSTQCPLIRQPIGFIINIPNKIRNSGSIPQI